MKLSWWHSKSVKSKFLPFSGPYKILNENKLQMNNNIFEVMKRDVPNFNSNSENKAYFANL